MAERQHLKDLRRGEHVSGIYLVEAANFKQSRNGKHFIQMMLRDHSASVKGLRWEAKREEFRRVERNPFIHVHGRVEEFQGALQIVIDELDTLSADDARVDPRDFLPRSRHDIDAMAGELEAIIAAIPDADVRRLVNAILDRPGVRSGLRSAPAGKVMHHAYIGGLLEHVLSLAKLAGRVLEHYTWLDPSVLMAGVVLHDLAKCEELSYQTGFGYTDEGQLVGHIVMGVSWIDEAARALGDLDPDKVLEVKHLVASHHGKAEYGAARTPMTPEALALHFIDNLDAKLAAYHQCWVDADMSPDSKERWGDYNPMLGTRLYYPRRLDAAPPPPPNPPPNPAPGSAPGAARAVGNDGRGGDDVNGDLPFA